MLANYWFQYVLPTEDCNNGNGAANLTVPWNRRFRALCRSRPHQAVKVIRVKNVSILVPFFRNGVKVIQLVRDPRGTYLSRGRFENGKRKPIHRECQTTLNDLQYIRKLYRTYGAIIKKSVYFLRYEDLAIRPMRTIFQVFKFLGVNPDKYVKTWVEDLQRRNTVGKGVPNSDAFNVTEFRLTYQTTKREYPDKTANAWRIHINMAMNLMIQDGCRDMMKEFGYRIFKTHDQLRNTTVPSLRGVMNLFDSPWFVSWCWAWICNLPIIIYTLLFCSFQQWPLLLTWFNFNPSMDK